MDVSAYSPTYAIIPAIQCDIIVRVWTCARGTVEGGGRGGVYDIYIYIYIYIFVAVGGVVGEVGQCSKVGWCVCGRMHTDGLHIGRGEGGGAVCVGGARPRVAFMLALYPPPCLRVTDADARG
jgi:hypothetical protein